MPIHTVFTIGHSTHDPGMFNELLDEAAAVADGRLVYPPEPPVVG